MKMNYGKARKLISQSKDYRDFLAACEGKNYVKPVQKTNTSSNRSQKTKLDEIDDYEDLIITGDVPKIVETLRGFAFLYGD